MPWLVAVVWSPRLQFNLRLPCVRYVVEYVALLIPPPLDSSVGIATDYGLDGPGIEYRWTRDFPHLSRPALGSTQPPVQSVPGLSRG